MEHGPFRNPTALNGVGTGMGGEQGANICLHPPLQQGREGPKPSRARHNVNAQVWMCLMPDCTALPSLQAGKRLVPVHPTHPSQHQKSHPKPPPFPVSKHTRQLLHHVPRPNFRQGTALMAQDQCGAESRCQDTDIAMM